MGDLYDRGHVYFTWGGTLGAGGQEIWQNGLRLAPDNLGSSAAFPTTTQANNLMTTLQAQWVNTSNGTGVSAYLKWIKFSRFDIHNELTNQPLVVATTPPAGVAGPSTTNPHPFQCTVVATLWSGLSFGKANYGRLYLPDPRIVVQTDGQMGGTLKPWIDWLGTWMKALETSAAAWPDGEAPMHCYIMHKGGEISSDPGTSKRITQVKMGSVMDTQRRRRNNLRETYTLATTYP